MASVCSHRHVWTFDNFLRLLVHDPRRLFGPWVTQGMRVMDAGCGAGFAALGLARLVGESGRVVAVDLQPQMLAKLRRRAQKAGLAARIETRRCRPEELGVSGRFGFVVAFWVVHEAPSAAGFLRQLSDRLAPGGRLFVAEPKFHVSRKAFERMLGRAEEAGLAVLARPRVFGSRAAVFGST